MKITSTNDGLSARGTCRFKGDERADGPQKIGRRLLFHTHNSLCVLWIVSLLLFHLWDWVPRDYWIGRLDLTWRRDDVYTSALTYVYNNPVVCQRFVFPAGPVIQAKAMSGAQRKINEHQNHHRYQGLIVKKNNDFNEFSADLRNFPQKSTNIFSGKLYVKFVWRIFYTILFSHKFNFVRLAKHVSL